jgi:hypothetical protein
MSLAVIDRGVHGPATGRRPIRVNIRRKPWSEAVVSKAKDRADSRLCCALGREEAQVLT